MKSNSTGSTGSQTSRRNRALFLGQMSHDLHFSRTFSCMFLNAERISHQELDVRFGVCRSSASCERSIPEYDDPSGTWRRLTNHTSFGMHLQLMSINDSDRFYVSVTSSEDLILYFGDLRLMVMFGVLTLFGVCIVPSVLPDLQAESLMSP